MNRTLSRRFGFTLIETLVVIVVIGLLAGLIIPAVLAARETARRAECLNNLKQLGVALSSYQSAHGCFPQGNNGHGYSLHAMLLPFIEQAPVYNAINFLDIVANSDAANLTVARTTIAAFCCPSDGSTHIARTNYAGSLGIPGLDMYPTPKAGANGVFTLHSLYPVPYGIIRYAEITDGASHTVAMSEWVITEGIHDRDPLSGVFTLQPPQKTLNGFTPACHDVDPSRALLNDNKGWEWLGTGLGVSLYNHVLTVNDHSCVNYNSSIHGAYTAGSRHGAGAHSLFADGSVRFIKQSAALQVWRALGTRNGSEAITDGSF